MSNPRNQGPSFRHRGKLTWGTVAVALLALAYQLLVGSPPGTGTLERTPAGQGQQQGNDAVAGGFDYLLLSLSWSPTYCEDLGSRRGNDPQCNGNRPYAFVLHGLWPQYTKGWPEDCPANFDTWVPNDVITSMLDIMPSKSLIVHEYKKHGTCSGLASRDYFQLARKMYESVRIPDAYTRLNQRLVTNITDIEQDFLRANRNLKADMIAVTCKTGGSTPRLQEVRICFDKSGVPKACGDNERQSKLCRSDHVSMPPVR